MTNDIALPAQSAGAGVGIARAGPFISMEGTHMKGKKWILRGVLVAALMAAILLVSRVTIVYDDPEGADDLTFAERYTEENWDSKMLPTIAERAVDIGTFIADIHQDLDAAGETHGYRTNQTSAWSFCVEGTAKVIGIVNAEKASGTRLELDVAPYDGEADCLLQVSTVIKTNAIRDGVAFLKLDDFANQVEFAELTKAFNARVRQDVIDPLDAAGLVDKEIELLGCVSPAGTEAEDLLIIPVRLTVVGG